MINEEMKKFRALLDAEHIEWNDLSDNGACPICRTHFEYNGQRWSVIHGYGSYGGYDVFTGADEGLLEAYNFVEEPKGFLTAENAMQYVKGTKELGAKELGTKELGAREMLEKVQQLKEDCILNGFEKTDGVDQFLSENWMQILDILDDALYNYLSGGSTTD